MRRYYKHPKSVEEDKLRRLSRSNIDSAKLRRFIRIHGAHKIEVFRRNIYKWYCLTRIWEAKDFRGTHSV